MFFSFQEGSKESVVMHLWQELYDTLSSCDALKNNVIVDDRLQLTIGRRLYDAKRMGYPFIVVIGKNATHSTPYFELFDLLANEENKFTSEGLTQYLIEKIHSGSQQ